MKTIKDILKMCIDEYNTQLIKWYNWQNLPLALYMPVLAYDYIERGEY